MQAHAYFLPVRRAAFLSYAQSLGLEGSQLLQLLILREMNRRRLRAEWMTGKLAPPPRQPRGRSVPRQKVTARLKDPADAKFFQRYVEKLGLRRTDVTARIAENELRERCLEQFVRRAGAKRARSKTHIAH